MKNKHFNVVIKDGYTIHNIPYLHKFKFCGHIFVVHRAVVGCGLSDLRLSKDLFSVSHFRTGGGIELKHPWVQFVKEKAKQRISNGLCKFEFVIKSFPTINK